MGRFSLGIVVPARNEEKTIGKVIDSIKKYGDVLVVDDASYDKTTSILKKTKVKFLRNHNVLGYEETVLKGMRHFLKKKYKYIKNAKYLWNGGNNLLKKKTGLKI